MASASFREEDASSADEVVVSAPRSGPGKKRGYEDLVRADGPLTLAVLIGQPKGRWWPELQGDSPACKTALAMVSAAADLQWPAVLAEPGGCDFVAGVAIIQGWHCVLSAASHADTYALMQASEAFHRKRSGHRYLEHAIVAVATLGQQSGGFLEVPDDCQSLPPGVAGVKIIDHLLSVNADAHVSAGHLSGSKFGLGQLLSAWEARYQVERRACVAWPATSSLASAMASGKWHGDVSVRHRRQLPLETTMAPVVPSVGLLRHFASMDVGCLQPPPAKTSADVGPREGRRGFVQPYHPAHIVASLQAGLHLRDRRNLKDTLIKGAHWLFGQNWRSVLASRASRDVDSQLPHHTTQRRNIVRLDWAAMLARRKWYKANGPTYRYLAYDASPQRGHEFFVTVERVVLWSALDSASIDVMPQVESRVLPLCVLGCGRMGLAEKVQTHIHQVWLDYGPSVADVRSANLDVRQCLSDMGTEIGIADARDVVAECLGQPREEDSDDSPLYPIGVGGARPAAHHRHDAAARPTDVALVARLAAACQGCVPVVAASMPPRTAPRLSAQLRWRPSRTFLALVSIGSELRRFC